MSIFTRSFWTEAAELAARGAAHAALLVIGADQVNVLELDWANLGGFAVGGAVLSVLTSIVSAGKTGHPSLVRGQSDGPIDTDGYIGDHQRDA